MSIFKRRKADDGSEDRAGDVTGDVTESEPGLGAAASPDPDEGSASREDVELADRSNGPYDVSEVDGLGNRLDVGALWLPLVDGVELQLQVDQATEQVTGVFVVLGEGAVQLQAFAAPRSEGIWGEICDEIAASITEQGGTADPGYGRFGRELLARVPSQQPDGKVGFAPMRFTGVNGPRWLLRAVFHGRAAIEPEAARAIEDLVAQVVVVRGIEPMGPRELLALKLPDDAQVAGGPEAEVDGGTTEGEPVGFEDLAPFERGPEITERR